MCQTVVASEAIREIWQKHRGSIRSGGHHCPRFALPRFALPEWRVVEVVNKCFPMLPLINGDQGSLVGDQGSSVLAAFLGQESRRRFPTHPR